MERRELLLGAHLLLRLSVLADRGSGNGPPRALRPRVESAANPAIPSPTGA